MSQITDLSTHVVGDNDKKPVGPLVFVVDNDGERSEIMQAGLKYYGFSVQSMPVDLLRACIRSETPDAVVLELQSAMDAIRWLRDEHVAIVSYRQSADDLDALIDRVLALEIGADDAIDFPFHFRELKARIDAVLWRKKQQPALPKRPAVITAGDIVVNLMQRTAKRADKSIQLTTGEFDLLAAFARCPNQVMTRERLLALARNREPHEFDRTIDVQIGRLRKKLEDDPRHPCLIMAIKGIGYVLRTAAGA